MSPRARVAAIRAAILEGDTFTPDCPHCAESWAVLQLDDARDVYVAKLARDDCPQHRIQQIRRALAIIDQRFDLLMRSAASPSVH
jgi:hypothetical protein